MNFQNNAAYIDDEINTQLLPPVDAHNQVVVYYPSEGISRRQSPAPLPQEYYRGNVNITEFDWRFVLPPLPHGHTFMVTSSLMHILITRVLFSGLPSEDPHAHIAKLRSVCKIFVGRPDLDMDVIWLRVFPLSLTGEAAI